MSVNGPRYPVKPLALAVSLPYAIRVICDIDMAGLPAYFQPDHTDIPDDQEVEERVSGNA